MRSKWIHTFFRVLFLTLAFGVGISATLGGTAFARVDPPPPAYQFAGQLPLASSCFDMMAFAHHQLYLADATNRQIDVFDLASAAKEHAIGTREFTGEAGCLHFDFSQMGPSGLLIDPEQRLWATDGHSTILIFNRRGQRLATINTEGQDRVDALALDPQQQVVLAVNADDPQPFVSLIDLHHLHTLERVSVPGADEAVWDGVHQRFLLAEPNALAVFQVTHNHLHQRANWPLSGCQAAGIALGGKQQALVGCSNGGAMLINTSTGAIEARIASSAVDLVSYSPTPGEYALATFTGTSTEGAILLVDQTGKVRQQLSTAPLSHAVFQIHSWLVVPERGKGLMLYRC